MDPAWLIGTSAIQILQSHTWALPFMKLASALGIMEFYLLMLPAIYWCWSPRLGIRMVLILVLSTCFSDVLKIIIHSPRPYWISQEIKALSNYPSFSIPSGHAMNAVCVWGTLAGFLEKPWAWWMASLLIFLIGFSRIYLGVHFPSDTIAGWATGAILLWGFMRLEPFLAERFRILNFGQKALVSIIASASILALYPISLSTLGDWRVPDEWFQIALAGSGVMINPLSPEEFLIAAGMIFGASVGYIFMQSNGGFEVDGTKGRKIMRYISGMAGLLLIWIGIGTVAHGQSTLTIYSLWYLRAFLAGAWVAAGAPIMFVRLMLAKKGGC